MTGDSISESSLNHTGSSLITSRTGQLGRWSATSLLQFILNCHRLLVPSAFATFLIVLLTALLLSAGIF